MKIYNEFRIQSLSPRMQAELDTYRAKRGFCAEFVLAAKVKILNDYFSVCGLDTAVIAVSGGVDSALVLALVNAASKEAGSPIKRIVPVTLPAGQSAGVTGQDSSQSRAAELCDALQLNLVNLDISGVVDALTASVEAGLGIQAQNWAKGQLVSNTRTPFLYHFTTLLTENGGRAVLVGTTNGDEGQYLGYVGKVSDGCVDIQLISDLHKSEVYALASLLSVPKSIIDVTPTGDMYDGRVDEEVFGFPYGFVELYRSYQLMSDQERASLKADLEVANELDVFDKLSANVENMHGYNKHKYLSCSPAVHMDVLDIRVPGGWKYLNFG